MKVISGKIPMYRIQLLIDLNKKQDESKLLAKYFETTKDNAAKTTKTKRTFFTFFIFL
jgi:hypothetical protein